MPEFALFKLKSRSQTHVGHRVNVGVKRVVVDGAHRPNTRKEAAGGRSKARNVLGEQQLRGRRVLVEGDFTLAERVDERLPKNRERGVCKNIRNRSNAKSRNESFLTKS